MSRLIKISDGKIEVGVIPDLGGMVALLRIVGKPNILKADASLWGKPPVIRANFGTDPRWKAYNGHIVWLGPQSKWWAQQTVNLKKRAEKAVWPPDPYINNGNYEVVEQNDTGITMRSPKSEISGIQLHKSIRIRGGRVYFRTAAQNIRGEPVSWGLWLNTRVDGYARCYAPLASSKKMRIDGRVTNTADLAVFAHEDGFCRTVPQAPSEGKIMRCAKAFIPASDGAMAAFVSSQALVIKFTKHAAKLIHPEQSLVEFYNYTNNNRDDALTELEYHAPYVTLAPGGWMDTTQKWDLYPFKDNPSHKSCVDFLRGIGI